MAYNEGVLVQVLRLDYLRNELNRDKSICAMDEIFSRRVFSSVATISDSGEIGFKATRNKYPPPIFQNIIWASCILWI
jgi:hypothetical protein